MNEGIADFVGRAREYVALYEHFQNLGMICRQGDFFPGIAYPPVTMYPPIDPDTLLEGYCPPRDGAFDLYLHVPFCDRCCTYCHYPVQVRPDEAAISAMLEALVGELDLYLRRFALGRLKVRSILLGGGTPTYLQPAVLDHFLGQVASRIDTTAGTQFNVDLDPQTMLGTIGAERLSVLAAHGVDRLTIGINSFDDRILAHMNRPHDAAEAVIAIRRAQEVGFQLDIEFIFGYPHQTLESWTDTMMQAIALQPEEIQIYRLKVKPYGDRTGTITRMIERKQIVQPEWQQAILMKRCAHLLFEADGRVQTLIRVFAKDPNIYSRYAESLDCTLRDLLALGPTAFSSFPDRFFLNCGDFRTYIERIRSGCLAIDRGVLRNREQQVRWALALPLRCRSVRRGPFERQTGVALDRVFPLKLRRLEDHGLLTRDAEGVALTPRGRFFADEIALQFYQPQFQPFPRADYREGPLNPYHDSEQAVVV
ncbi:MAG: hypothetical protein A2284_08710 [Deltaproteobacteria bacterium RIFOXYA12_FULL_61_11]|nr:MAG: hypothetical protein A2284_08710 [Deltaproteobacteria bacterium RIFOXYA12_FULL_61_11]